MRNNYEKIDVTKLEKTTDITDVEIGCLLYVSNEKYQKFGVEYHALELVARCNSINQADEKNEYSIELEDLHIMSGDDFHEEWELNQRHINKDYQIYPITKENYPEYFL